MIKKYENIWIKIRFGIRAIIKNLNDYGEKHMKINFDSDDDLSLNKTIEISLVKIFAAFYENNRCHPQMF